MNKGITALIFIWLIALTVGLGYMFNVDALEVNEPIVVENNTENSLNIDPSNDDFGSVEVSDFEVERVDLSEQAKVLGFINTGRPDEGQAAFGKALASEDVTTCETVEPPYDEVCRGYLNDTKKDIEQFMLFRTIYLTNDLSYCDQITKDYFKADCNE